MKEITHKNCNGWAIYDSQYIAGDQPHNIHVVATFVEQAPDGTSTSRPNDELKTMCGNQALVQAKRSCILASTSAVEIRQKLAELQNSGSEVCGQCVATFYADEEESE